MDGLVLGDRRSVVSSPVFLIARHPMFCKEPGHYCAPKCRNSHS